MLQWIWNIALGLVVLVGIAGIEYLVLWLLFGIGGQYAKRMRND